MSHHVQELTRTCCTQTRKRVTGCKKARLPHAIMYVRAKIFFEILSVETGTAKICFSVPITSAIFRSIISEKLFSYIVTVKVKVKTLQFRQGGDYFRIFAKYSLQVKTIYNWPVDWFRRTSITLTLYWQSNYFSKVQKLIPRLQWTKNCAPMAVLIWGTVRISESVGLRQRPRKYGVILSKMTV